MGQYAWEASGWFWRYGNPYRKDLSSYAEKGDWKSVSEAINSGDPGTFPERNQNFNIFYKIMTGKSLGLPE